MDSPPTYEKVVLASERSLGVLKDEMIPHRFSIRDEVGASKSQHVAALVEKVLPQVRDRAQSGQANSTLLLLPSGQDAVGKGMLVGWWDDETPILIQLEGRHDSLEFWTQKEALTLLQDQLLGNLDSRPTQHVTAERALPSRKLAPRRSSLFSRKQAKAQQGPRQPNDQTRAPVTVEVMLDEVNFRHENGYGLYETV